MGGIIPAAKRRKLFNIDQSAGKPLTLAFVHAELQRTPSLHRAKKSLIKECGLKGSDSDDLAGEKP